MSDQSKLVAALPAATILMVKDASDGLEVLMLRRPETMRFAPGALVFPGGKVDAEDKDKSFWNTHTNMDPLPEDYAYRVGAHREMFEEVGIWHLDGDHSVTDPVLGGFNDIVQERGLYLDLKQMHPFAHWVTPEGLPMRFDTLFYLCPLKGEQTAYHEGDEAMELQWVRPQEVLLDWESEKVPLMFPTRLTLMKLARASTVSEAVKLAIESEMVTTMPEIRTVDGMRTVTIPEEAGYGVTAATQRELSVEGPRPRKVVKSEEKA